MDDLPPYGLSRLFPVKVNNLKDQNVDTELQLRRIPIVETTNNTLEIASLVQALGQPNWGGSRVFWILLTKLVAIRVPITNIYW